MPDDRPDDRQPIDAATDEPPLSASLRAGAALYRAGRYRAAAVAWAEPSRPSRTTVETAAGEVPGALCAGLASLATAVERAAGRDWAGATAAATDARERLSGLPDDAAGVRLAPVRAFLAALAADPARIERASPVVPAIGGSRPRVDELTFPAAGVAARSLAAAVDAGDEARRGRGTATDRDSPHRPTVERAVAYASRDLERDETKSPFPGLILDYLTSPGGPVLDRLTALVDRRVRREADLDGLF